jgi:hypothetical protein
MLRVYSRVFLLLILCAALAWTARAYGMTLPPNPALAGFRDGCAGLPGSCWYGIVPGQTKVQQAEAMLRARSLKMTRERAYYPTYWQRLYANPGALCSASLLFQEDYVVAAVSVECRDIFFGDFVRVLGDPVRQPVFTSWAFGDNEVQIQMQFNPADPYRCLDFMPFGRVAGFYLHKGSPALPAPDGSDRQNQRWHGFLPYAQYVHRYGLPSCDTLRMLP